MKSSNETMTREEAIAVIRKNYPHVGFSGTEFETALRELIPELAEIEDEKIRKGIIKFFSENEVTPIISYEAKLAWLNWLERQKTPSVSFDKPPIGFDAGSAVVYHNDESEDERIRKALISLVDENAYTYKSFAGVELTDMLAYLEKQKPISFNESFNSDDYETVMEGDATGLKRKEQKPNYCHYGGDPNIERCRCCSAACSGRLADEQKPKAKAKSPLSPHELYDAKIEGISQGRQDVIDHPEQFGLQKPAERREVELTFRGEKVKVKRHFFRDDKGREYSTTEQDEDAAWYALRAWCEKKGISMYDLYPRKEWSEEDEKIIETICKEGDLKPSEKHWLKSLPERLNLQPKNEWSEEDEVEKNRIYLKGYNDAKREMESAEWGDDIIQKAIKEVGLTQHQIDWFKTNVFPPKQEWSEEEALNRTYEEGFNDGLKYRKPVKRSDEDKKMSDWLIGLVNANIELSFKDKVNLTRWLEHLTIEKELPKNDKRIIDAIMIGYQDKDFSSSQIPTPIGVSKDEVIDWLKSLRPSWKPSEEDINAIGRGN